jgi:predicted PurR-regulated permease PerM
MFGNLLTSLIAGIVVLTTLLVLGVPFPLLWGLRVALVDFLPMIGGALAGIPTVLFAVIARALPRASSPRSSSWSTPRSRTTS